MKNTVIETLKLLGLTEYEAKAYVSIVGLGMSSAREIHENSGVPLGRIYSVLKDLADKGFVDVQEGNPVYYSSPDPSIILNSLRIEINKNIDDSIKYLGKVHYDTKPMPPFWTIRNEWSVKNRMKSLIVNAEEEIIFVVEDFSVFKWMLKDVLKAKKRLNIDIYTDNKSDFKGTNLRVTEFSERSRKFRKQIREKSPEFIGKSMETKLLMIIDESSAFVISATDAEMCGTIILMPSFVYMVKNHISIIEGKDL